jgi:hypothetical protein
MLGNCGDSRNHITIVIFIDIHGKNGYANAIPCNAILAAAVQCYFRFHCCAHAERLCAPSAVCGNVQQYVIPLS